MRVGLHREPSHEHYEAAGAWMRAAIVDILPGDWTFEHKRVLDFGCGAGRILRQFADVASEAEVWGCDIHPESISWLEENLSPPFHCFRNDTSPPLPVGPGRFDLVWAMSVFTHIADDWAAWLLEMHRVIAPGGLFVASYLGDAVLERLLGEAYAAEEVGMLVQHHDRPPEEGGAWVFHSEWWLRKHWGPAFEILEVRDAGSSGLEHGLLLGRRRPEAPDANEMTVIDGSDPREIAGLQTEIRMLRREVERSRARQSVGARALARRLRRRIRRARAR
jgi:SAM-dependent methyltransferase